MLGADDLDTASLQALANEFALSETAFPMAVGPMAVGPMAVGPMAVGPMAADVPGADYRLRIFTPETELPFAGHPSIGAAWVLARRGDIPTGSVVQSCGAGSLPLEVGADCGPVTLTGGSPSFGPPRDPGELLAGVGLTVADLAGEVRDASCGLGFTVLPVGPDALARLRVDLAALRRIGLGAGGPFGGLDVVAWDGRSARCRVLAFEAGVAEDPATGSAALALGAYLAACALVPPDGETAYDVVQGVEMGRPSLLSCSVTVVAGAATTCRVRGSVVPVAAGRIRRP